MSAFIIKPIVENVPAPILWAAAGAASCCVGLCTGLYYVNPLAFEILMAEEDDEDAINNAIGQSALNMFAHSIVISVVANGGLSYYSVDSEVSAGCCVACCVTVGCLTAWCKLQDTQKVGEDMAEERKKKKPGVKALGAKGE